MIFDMRIGKKWSMNVKGQGHLVTLAQGRLNCRSIDISKYIFSEITWPISFKFYMQPVDSGGMKVCSKWSRSHDQDCHHAQIW